MSELVTRRSLRERGRGTRFHELDGIRAIAVLMVLVGHYTLTYDDLYHDATLPPFQFRYGLYGVQLFFLVSGYVILKSVQHVRTPSDFAISRAARLFPAYWIAVTWSIILAIAFNPLDVTRSWRDRLLNYTMMQRWLGAGNVDSVYWTLAIEVQFYALIFLILCVSKVRRRQQMVVLVSVLWLTIAFVTALLWGSHSRGHGLSETPMPYKLIFNVVLTEYAPLFCTGMFAYLARSQDRRYWFAAVGSAASAAVTAFLMHESRPGIVVAILCTGFLVVCALPSVPPLRWAPLLWVGKISYSLYLVHNVFGITVMHALIPTLGRVPSMLVASVLSCLLADALYRVGEVVLTRALRVRLTRLRDSWRTKTEGSTAT